MTENEAIEELKFDCNELGKAIPCDTSWGKSFENAYAMAINALEEVQKYRKIEKDLKERYHANVDIPLLMHHFIETVFEGEKHEGFCLLTNEDAKVWEEYKAIGTPEECRTAVEKQTAKKVKSISQVKDGDSYVGLIGRCPCCGDILENEIDQTGMGKAFFFSTKGDVDAIDFIKNHIRYAYYAEYYDGFQAPFTVCAWNGTVDFLIELAKKHGIIVNA